MRYTQNINLPIVEDNDLYSKEINNLAFEKIDEEIQGLADIVETLDSPENSIADVKKDINDIKSDVVDINEQLDNIVRNTFGKIYLSDYGILPNEDITDKLIELFNVIPSYSCIEFEKDQTYLISKGGIRLNARNVTINGNNATLKLKDNSGYIENIKNSDISRTILILKGENIELLNLNFDGNIENNYFIHEGNKFYAYHPDLNISGLPNKQIFYDVVSFVGNGFYAKGLNFTKVPGGSINLGNTSEDLTTNVNIYNCAFSKNFRGVVTFFNTKNTLVENCRFYHNQRHAIQYYTANSYGKINGCRILNTVSDIPKWYPTWNINNPDCETIGVSLGHGDYSDYNGHFSIINCNIDYDGAHGIKNGIAIRNYVDSVDILNSTIKAHWQSIFIRKGIRGTNNFKFNKFNKNVENGIRIDFGTGNSNIEPATVNAILNVENNYIGGVYSIIFENATDETVKASYKKLTINLNNNEFYNNINNFSGLTNLIENTNSPIVDVILNDNLVEGTNNYNYLNAYLINKLITIRNKNITIIPNNYSAQGLIKIAKICLKANKFVNINGTFKSYGKVDYVFDSRFFINIKASDITNNPTVKFSVVYKTANLPADFLRVVLAERTDTELTLYFYIKFGDYSITKLENNLGSSGVVTFIGDRRSYSSYDVTNLHEYKSS